MARLRSCLALCPDEPQGPDDPHCRYVAGAMFGFDMARGEGRCEQPPVELMLNDPRSTPAAALITEIWLPLEAD